MFKLYYTVLNPDKVRHILVVVYTSSGKFIAPNMVAMANKR